MKNFSTVYTNNDFVIVRRDLMGPPFDRRTTITQDESEEYDKVV